MYINFNVFLGGQLRQILLEEISSPNSNVLSIFRVLLYTNRFHGVEQKLCN